MNQQLFYKANPLWWATSWWTHLGFHPSSIHGLSHGKSKWDALKGHACSPFPFPPFACRFSLVNDPSSLEFHYVVCDKRIICVYVTIFSLMKFVLYMLFFPTPNKCHALHYWLFILVWFNLCSPCFSHPHLTPIWMRSKRTHLDHVSLTKQSLTQYTDIWVFI